jgi:predicted acyl esterase
MSTAGEVMQYEVLVERDVKVAMCDGIKLACDVYRPAHAGQAMTGTFPVILERTLYT